jgi:hypothetical protein
MRMPSLLGKAGIIVSPLGCADHSPEAQSAPRGKRPASTRKSGEYRGEGLFIDEETRYTDGMTLYSYYIVYPDGDSQEIPAPLSINQLVDMNGIPLSLPLETSKTIAYRVVAVRHREERGQYDVLCKVELVGEMELREYARPR